MYKISGIFLFLSLWLLSGCGIVGDKAVDYKKAKSSTLPSLEIPPDLGLRRSDQMKIPETPSASTATASATGKEAILSGGETVLPEVEGIRLHRRGDTNWLESKNTAAVLWPKVRSFWDKLGFKLRRDEPEIGLMETSWQENRANIKQDIVRRTVGKAIDFLYESHTRDQFRVRFEKIAQEEGTEIYLTHRGMEQVNQGETFVWQSRPSDPELEIEMLKLLMVSLGAEETQAATQADAAKKQGKPATKAVLHSPENETGFIELSADFKQAWQDTGLALDRANFNVEDRDRSAGHYLVRYLGPAVDKDSGFFSKLAFWKDDKKYQEHQYKLHLESSGENKTRLGIVQQDGEVKDVETMKRILEVLLEQLQ